MHDYIALKVFVHVHLIIYIESWTFQCSAKKNQITSNIYKVTVKPEK